MNRRLVLLSVLALFMFSFCNVSLWAGQSRLSGNTVIQAPPDLSGPVLKPAPAPLAIQSVKGKSEVVPSPSPRLPIPGPFNPLPAVPRTMSYQGKLTNSGGLPVPDGNYQLILNLYTAPSGGSAIWTETDTVATKSGLFNVPMGAKVPLNLTFNQDYWLGVAAAGDPEMSPRTKLTSSGYAFRADSSSFSDRAASSSFADRSDSSAFADTAGASARVGGHAAASSGLGIVPYTDGTTGLLNPAVIPAGGTPGPHGSTHAPGGSDPVPGYVKLAGDSMTGTLKVGATGTAVIGYASMTSPNMSAYGVYGSASSTSSSGGYGAYGAYGYATNTAGGSAYGGNFYVPSNGTGLHIGVSAEADGNSSSPAYGAYGLGQNSSSGNAYGGYFGTLSTGTGTHYGAYGAGYGASSSPVFGAYDTASNSSTGDVYGSYGAGDNSSTGSAYGGRFNATSSGTGTHYGVYAEGYGASGNPTYGSLGYASNTSTGDAVGGNFTTDSHGTGTHIGVWTYAPGSSSSPVYGVSGNSGNSSTGKVYGGRFNAASSGTGTHYGVFGEAYGASSSSVFGAYDTASNSSSGTAYGSYSVATNTSSSSAYGGYFTTTSSGTGEHIGVSGTGNGASSTDAMGAYCAATNTSTGSVFAGYFVASPLGTGTHYGVYGVEAAGGAGAAVYANGDIVASGTKSAVVRTTQGEKLVYCTESPELWFEDVGEGRLTNGRGHVDLDPLYLETVTIDASHPMRVFVQLTSGDPVQVVVTKGTRGFDVSAAGPVSATFDYRILAKRKGYENERMRTTDVGKDDPNLYPERRAEIEAKWAKMRPGGVK